MQVGGAAMRRRGFAKRRLGGSETTGAANQEAIMWLEQAGPTFPIW